MAAEKLGTPLWPVQNNIKIQTSSNFDGGYPLQNCSIAMLLRLQNSHNVF